MIDYTAREVELEGETIELTKTEYAIIEFLSMHPGQVLYGFLVFSVPGVVIAVLLFYRNKIQKPLQELEAAYRRIEENDLDFHISYENRDELGQLCAGFERMRTPLSTLR